MGGDLAMLLPELLKISAAPLTTESAGTNDHHRQMSLQLEL